MASSSRKSNKKMPTFVILLGPTGDIKKIPFNEKKSLEILQNLVDGYITTLKPKSYLSSQIILPATKRKSFRWFCFCNDEGLLNGMIPNIYSKVEHYETHSMPMIFGPIVLTQQNSKGDTMGITQSEIDSLEIDVFKSIQTPK